MKREKILVIMAAGLGSRFGGLKQAAPVDDNGCLLIDYSMYDAIKAGFTKIVCIIKPEMEADFAEVILSRMGKFAEVQFAYQTMDALPEGFTVPEGRTKPFGTAHAVLCAKDLIDAPFAVINADDFYGPTAFQAAADFLDSHTAEDEYAMVGYKIENTLSDSGSVARGVCEVNAKSYLTAITERTKVVKEGEGAAFTEDGETYTFVPAGTFVSMNLWAFQPSIMPQIEKRFAPWLSENLPKNPLKCEYFLPLIPDLMLKEGLCTVKVEPTSEVWYGMTYKEDLQQVKDALKEKVKAGVYPEYLWRE